jgi:hypothetical protein
MTPSFWYQWCFLLLSLLISGCTDPSAFRLEDVSPEQHNLGGADAYLTFKVYHLDPTQKVHWQQISQQADFAVEANGRIGKFNVQFIDGISGKPIVQIGYLVTFDEILSHPKSIVYYHYAPAYNHYANRPQLSPR